MNDRQKCLASFQKLARYRASDDNGYVTCISCGRRLKVTEAEGGHYIPRRHRATELHPDNVRPQCHECNQIKHGNVEEYRKNLILEIGIDRVEKLESIKHERSEKDYLTLKRKFDAQIRKIRKEKMI